VRISAAVKPLGTSFSKFIGAAAKKNIALDRKILSTLAQENPETFTRIVKEVMA
jgi:large subunit ribosomal protein L20